MKLEAYSQDMQGRKVIHFNDNNNGISYSVGKKMGNAVIDYMLYQPNDGGFQFIDIYITDGQCERHVLGPGYNIRFDVCLIEEESVDDMIW